MNKYLQIFVVAITFLAFSAYGEASELKETKTIVSFNKLIIGPYGVSVSNIMDRNQSIKMDFVGEDALGNPEGKSLRLDYDVNSYEKAKAEFWLRLKGLDLSKFDTLNLYLRGDSKKGSSKTVTLRFLDGGNRAASYIVTGITKEWKKFKIPLKKFSRIQDWSRLNELGLIFDDVFSNPKEGTLYVDHISVSKS